MSESVEPPIPLPPAHRRLTVIGVFVAVIAFAALVGFVIRYSTAANGTATITPNPAIPLVGHYATINGQRMVMCDPSSVQAWTNGENIVTVHVNLGSPGTVEVWIGTSRLNGHFPMHLTQQVTHRDGGAEFTTWVADPNKWVNVLANNKHNVGGCSILPR